VSPDATAITDNAAHGRPRNRDGHFAALSRAAIASGIRTSVLPRAVSSHGVRSSLQNLTRKLRIWRRLQPEETAPPGARRRGYPASRQRATTLRCTKVRTLTLACRSRANRLLNCIRQTDAVPDHVVQLALAPPGLAQSRVPHQRDNLAVALTALAFTLALFVIRLAAYSRSRCGWAEATGIKRVVCAFWHRCGPPDS
jgi:hypothetical protein